MRNGLPSLKSVFVDQPYPILDLADQAKQSLKTMENDGIFWKDKYMKLAWLANQAIVDIPRALKEVEGMHEELRGDVNQLKEQMGRILKILQNLEAKKGNRTGLLKCHIPPVTILQISLCSKPRTKPSFIPLACAPITYLLGPQKIVSLSSP
ncbi:hypothetical protein CR513_53682, partial [Mucuna pruriens]